MNTNYIEYLINNLVNVLNTVGIKASYNETFFFVAGVITPYLFAFLKKCLLLPIINVIKRYIERINKQNIFLLLNNKFVNIKYFTIYPPIDIINEKNRIRININKSNPIFRIAPKKVDAIIKEIVETVDQIDINTPFYHEQVDYYKNRFQEGNFSEKDQFNLDKNISNYTIFKSLIKNNERFDEIKKQVLISYLTKREGFHFNALQLSIDQMRESRNNDEEEIFEILTQKTDYYSYRVISELSQEITSSSTLNSYLKSFHEYIGDSFQKNIHLGF